MRQAMERMELQLADLAPREYALLVVRVLLGIMHLSHALLGGGITGLSDGVHQVIFALELGGAALLILGIRPATVAIALMPVLAANAVLHWHSGCSLGWDVADLLACLAAQAWLAAQRAQRAEASCR